MKSAFQAYCEEGYMGEDYKGSVCFRGSYRNKNGSGSSCEFDSCEKAKQYCYSNVTGSTDYIMVEKISYMYHTVKNKEKVFFELI